MKNYCTLILAIFWLTTSHAQCFDVLTVDWELDGTYELVVEVLDDGTMYPPDGGSTAVLIGQTYTYDSEDLDDDGFDELVWTMIYPDNTYCQYTFTVDTDTFINSYHLSYTDPSTCGGSDGIACASLPEFGPVSFYLAGESASFNGCVYGLDPGTYTYQFSNISSGGVIYSNPDRTIDIFGLQVVLVDVNGTLEGSASGGAPNYQYFYDSGLSYTDAYVNYEAGCFHVEAVDSVACSAESIAYYSPTIAGDLGDSDDCVNSADLLEFLGDVGLSYDILDGNISTQSDYNCDGLVNVADLLFLLSVFGNCCTSC